MSTTRRYARAAAALTLLLAAWSAHAGDKGTDWTVHVTDQSQGQGNGWQINIDSTTHYGAGSPRTIGSGKAVVQDRAVTHFDKVRMVGPVDVELHQTGSERVRVMADDNIEPLVDTHVEGDTLVIGLKKNTSFSTRGRLRVAVDFKSISALSMSGSGDAEVDQLSGARFAAALAGSGDLKVGSADLGELEGSIRGSGDISISGRAGEQSWSVAGSGDVSADKLSGKHIKVSIAGSGDVDVGSADSLEVSIAGSGDVSYAGHPALKTSVFGSGSVSAR
jgi:hypothetical protein